MAHSTFQRVYILPNKFPLTEMEGPQFAAAPPQVLVAPVHQHGALVHQGGVPPARGGGPSPPGAPDLPPGVRPQVVDPQGRLPAPREAQLAPEHVESLLVGHGGVLLETRGPVPAWLQLVPFTFGWKRKIVDIYINKTSEVL